MYSRSKSASEVAEGRGPGVRRRDELLIELLDEHLRHDWFAGDQRHAEVARELLEALLVAPERGREDDGGLHAVLPEALDPGEAVGVGQQAIDDD